MKSLYSYSTKEFKYREKFRNISLLNIKFYKNLGLISLEFFILVIFFSKNKNFIYSLNIINILS